MINIDSIYSALLAKIKVEYTYNGTNTIGAGMRVNDLHALVTPKAVADIAGFEVSEFMDKGTWDSGETYAKSDMVRYENLYWVCMKDDITETPEEETNWDVYDPFGQPIYEYYESQIKSIVHELYSKIKGNDQTVEVLESCNLFTRSIYETDDTARNLMIKPRLGTLKINRLEFNSDIDTTAALKIIDLKDNSETESALTIEKYLNHDVDLSSKYGFIISITPAGEVYRWLNSTINSNYTVIGENSDISDPDRYNEKYFSPPMYFLANVHLNVECDITQWFLDNIDSLVPYVAHKLALAWLKLVYYNGNTRGNLTENNPRLDQAYVEIFGDINAEGGLLHPVNELEKTAVSKYGYGDPCFKRRRGKIRVDGI